MFVYVCCFEGLLSAAGKELGMIEDASVAIDMLNMVSVEFVSESNDSPIAIINFSSGGSDKSYINSVLISQ